MGYEGYVSLNYISVSVIVACSLILLMFSYLESGNKMYCCIFIVQSMICAMVSIIIFVFACFVLIYCFVARYFFAERGKYNKVILYKFVFLLITSILLAGLLNFVDTENYKNSETRLKALEYRRSFEKSFSFGYASYDKEIAQSIGCDSQEEYNRLGRGIFVNGNLEDQEKMVSIVELKREMSIKTLNSYFKNVPIQLFRFKMTYLIIALFSIILLYRKDNKVYIIISTLLLIFAETSLLYCANSISYDWIKAGVLMFAGMYVLLYTDKIVVKKEDIHLLYVFLCMFLIIQFQVFSSDYQKTIKKDTPESIMVHLWDSRISIMDLTRMMANRSAFYIYPTDFCGQDNIYVANGVLSLADGFENAVNIHDLDNWLDDDWAKRVVSEDYVLINAHDLLTAEYDNESNKLIVSVKYLYPYDGAYLRLWSTPYQDDLMEVAIVIDDNGMGKAEIDVSGFQFITRMQIELHTQYRNQEKVLRKTKVTCK